MKAGILLLVLGLCIAVQGYDDSVNEAELENEDPFENEALDDEHNFHYDVRDNDVSKSMDEDEDAIEVKAEEHESDPKPIFRRIARGVKRLVKKIGKKVKKIGKKVIKHVKKIFRTKVCYAPYGCFTKARPFNLIWNILPQSPRSVKTKFHLYTRSHRNGVFIDPFKICPSNLKNRRTIFIVHGWKGGYSKAKWIRWYKDKFLQRGSFNVIGVYWGGGAKRNYFQAAGNTRLVGAQIAFLIERMHTVNRLSYSNVHLIGFSLGAHVAGFAGRRLRANGHPIARITGLDPASPVFARRPRSARLDSSDARYVDVIHTSYLFVVGIKQRSGDIDFYANGGGAQPGCKPTDAKCSHARVLFLFMNTILPTCRYKAYRCSNYLRYRLGRCRSCRNYGCAYMGYDVNKRARGKYFVKTRSRKPYC